MVPYNNANSNIMYVTFDLIILTKSHYLCIFVRHWVTDLPPVMSAQSF